MFEKKHTCRIHDIKAPIAYSFIGFRHVCPANKYSIVFLCKGERCIMVVSLISSDFRGASLIDLSGLRHCNDNLLFHTTAKGFLVAFLTEACESQHLDVIRQKKCRLIKFRMGI